jgi:hypothetical protein
MDICMTKCIPNSPSNHNAHDVAYTVTILTCTGNNFAAKTHRRASDGSLFTDGFNAGKYFDYEDVAFDNLNCLLDVITETSADPTKFMIRGCLRADAPQRGDGRVRRCNRKQADGEEPYFAETDRSWAMIDFDKVENPENFPAASIEAMTYLQTLLPPEFHDVECIYSLSSSAGLSDSDRISGHLWFVFDRPVSNQELKSWLSGYPVDMALFRTVQPHYIASPVFRDGLIDPIDSRNGLLSGSTSVVSVPVIDTSKPTYEHHDGSRGLETAHGYEAKIELLGDGGGKEGCHGVITPAIAAYMTRHGPQADREALKADIRKRSMEAPWDRAVHSEEYIAHEVCNEILDRSIKDWVEKIFNQSEGYDISEPDDVDIAREKVAQAVDNHIWSATRWQRNHNYRLELTKRGSLGFFNIDKQYVYDLDPPPRSSIAAQVGLGKTEKYLSQLGRLLPALRRGHCIFISVSNHRLSEELNQRLWEHSIEAEVYLGPAQDDPDQPGETMCRVPDKLQVFQEAGIGWKLCDVCPFNQHCGFQKQRLKKSQVWIGAHQIVFRKRRLPIPPVDFIIIDEDPLPAGLEGNNSKQLKWLSCEEVPDDVRKAIEKLPLGVPFSRDDFSVSDRRIHELARRAYAQKQKVTLTETSSKQDLDEAFATAQANSRLVEQARFYRAIAENGPWGMRTIRVNGHGIVLRWVRQRKIHSNFDVPILFADATFNEDAIEQIIDIERPPADVEGAWIDEDGSIVPAMNQRQPVIIGPTTSITAKTPFATFRQILFSGAAGLFKGNIGDNNVSRIRRYIEGRSAGFSRTLVICQLDLEERLCELGLPPNVEIAHFNAIRGQDKWKDVDLLIVIGRTQPSPGAVELQAEVVFRTPIKSLGPDYYDSTWMPLTGTDVLVPTEHHPDKFAEIIRWHACEAEIIQAIGRVRAVNRNAENPVQVDIINKVPLPDVVIDEVVEWDDAQPDPGAVIAGRYGLWIAGEGSKGVANVVAELLPDLFSTPNAARKVKVYSRCQTPNSIYLLGEPHREYTGGPEPTSAPWIAVKAPGCRFAVLAHAMRPPTRRPLVKGETPPKGADVNDEGVLSYGPTYVLKHITRRLKVQITGS